MHTARRGDGTCPALGIKEQKLPPPSPPDFLGTRDDIIFLLTIKNFSRLTKQRNFYFGRTKKIIYLSTL